MRDRFKLVVNKWGVYVVAGMLLGVGFVWPVFWPLGIVGVPVYLYAVAESRSLLQALLGSAATFTIKMSLVLSWFWSTYPITVLQIDFGKSEIVAIGFFWLLVSFFIGVAGMVAGFLLFYSKEYFTRWWFILSIIPIWILTEVFGSILFSVFTLGSGGAVNAVFSFGYSGYLLANHGWLLQIASFGGVYILSAVVALGGALMYMYWSTSTNRTKATELLVIGVLLLAVSASFAGRQGDVNPESPNFSVAIIDTTFGGEDYFAREDLTAYKQSQLREALTAALESGARYVVMSEDSRYLDPQLAPDIAYGYFRFQNGDPYAVVVEAGPVPLRVGEVALRATLYDGVDKKAYGVDKQYLVPQGEFMPEITSLVLKLVGNNPTAMKVDTQLQYRPGPLDTQHKLSSHLPGVLFCFASADPLGVKSLVNERSVPFIAHPISHAWFHEPTSMWHQFDTMLKIHAVWNEVPIVSAGNMVDGALYTATGAKQTGVVYAEGERWTVSLVGW